MATKHNMMTYPEQLLLIKSLSPFASSCKITEQTRAIISPFLLPLVTKLDWVVTYNEELTFVKLHDPSITWFCEVT